MKLKCVVLAVYVISRSGTAENWTSPSVAVASDDEEVKKRLNPPRIMCIIARPDTRPLASAATKAAVFGVSPPR